MAAEHPSETLRCLAKENSIDDVTSAELAILLDKRDPLSKYRELFHYPKMKTLPRVDASLVNSEDESVYLCGHSLGLCPKKTDEIMAEELKKWAHMGVEGRIHGKYPWAFVEGYIVKQMANLVGSKPIEVWPMNTLSVNLNVMMVTFYKPTPKRHKIVIEAGAFPSDHIAVQAQIRYHGYEPATSLIEVKPKPGKESIDMDDIIQLIEKEGDEIALVMFAGVQYYTGQFFDLKRITEAGHKKGCYVGFDLAHAVGNVKLELHDWDVDFACWCTYKYMNSGPGATGGVYLHEKYAHENYNIKRHAGWWGVDIVKRFAMDNSDLPFVPGAAGFAHSSPPLFSTMGLLASLEIFEEIGMDKLVEKQRLLTGYLELLINTHFKKPSEESHVTYITPLDVTSRGCQLSFAFSFPIERVFEDLLKRGVVCDMRKPKVLRIAPAPLYNSFQDVHRFLTVLLDVIEKHKLDAN